MTQCNQVTQRQYELYRPNVLCVDQPIASKHWKSTNLPTSNSDSRTASILLVGSCIVELAAGIPLGPGAQSQRVPRVPEDCVVCCLTLLCLLFWTVVTAGAFVTFFVNCASLKRLFIIIIIILSKALLHNTKVHVGPMHVCKHIIRCREFCFLSVSFDVIQIV